MNKITLAAAAATLALALTACGGANPGTDNPLPQGSVATSTVKPNVEEPTKTKATSCDVAREAILTGSKKQIDKAFKALIADKKADVTAREAAQEYFQQTDKQLKQMQVDLIQMACSI